LKIETVSSATLKLARAKALACMLAIIIAVLFQHALQAEAGPPYELEKPSFVDNPQVVTSLLGATYTYAAESPKSLMITIMAARDVRRQMGALSDIQCANLFIAELRATHSRFFVVNMTRPLIVGTAKFVQFRWSGEKSHRTLTGVVSCGTIGDAYYVIHFVDDLTAATHSFPAIRASLKTLRPHAK
jgi:hypothetical protein